MTIERCNRCLEDPACQNKVVNQCLPVDAFGNVLGRSVKLATIGLNPALNEYYRQALSIERSQRLPLLSDYGLTNRADLEEVHIADAKKRREKYFSDSKRNWHSYFEKMEGLFSRVEPKWSYISGRVVHIDLIACATHNSLGNLAANCKTALLANCREHFLTILSQLPSGTMLFLDGKTVVNEIQNLGFGLPQENREELINVGGNQGYIGKLSFADRVFPFRGWSMPVSKLTVPLRYDLAFWLCGTMRPKLPFPPFS